MYRRTAAGILIVAEATMVATQIGPQGRQLRHPLRHGLAKAWFALIWRLGGGCAVTPSGTHTPKGAYMTTTVSKLHLAVIKGQQQQTWAAGDYAMVGTTLLIISERLCEAVDLRAGQQVLDVATGHGNTALAAARRFSTVVGVDYVPALLERAWERASVERLPVSFQHGDAEALPFPDAAFDVVLSTLGVMFAPNHEQTAQELLRVCRPGGKIGLANWTPQGFIGELFRVIAKHVPPKVQLAPASLWGTEAYLGQLFGHEISDLRAIRRNFVFRYPSPQHWVEFFREYYGPMSRAFAALDYTGQAVLTLDLLALIARYNRSGDATMVVPGEYLEAVATRAG
jgi:ubiquinone/menaquinone biosynthesis C-methylase UbiE